MKLFRCDHCGRTLYFENTVCEHCRHRLGYEPDANMLLSLEPIGDAWSGPVLPGKSFVFCANAEHGACNWLIPVQSGGEIYCRACRHNEMVPPIGDSDNLSRWRVIERAKKRLIYSLLRLRLPLATRKQDAVHGLAFRFLNEALAAEPVFTGHRSGVITLALAEADDAQREYRRTLFKEPYRTLLGHFRHETGHHYWDILVGGQPAHAEFRALFGDESQPYDAALQGYYQSGSPADWQQSYISAYAAAHPWEDFAETFAHYLHLVDTTEMASAFNVRMAPPIDRQGELRARIDFDPYTIGNISELIDDWVPLASLINNLNRAVGQPDAYPFVLTPAVINKLGFVHRLVRAAGAVQWQVPGPGQRPMAPAAPMAEPSAQAPLGSDAAIVYNVADTDQLATKIIGAGVYSSSASNADRFGDINDIVLDDNGQVAAVVIGVGGFLGLGEKQVAVNFDALQWVVAEDNSERYVLATTKEALESAPDFVARDDQPVAAARPGNVVAPAATPMAGDNAALDRSTMTAVDAGTLSAEQLIGTSVMGPQNDRLGEIGDIILMPEGKVDAVIVDFGGFLGLGEKQVAVGYDNLEFTRDANGATYLWINATREQLEAAPAYDEAAYTADRAGNRLVVGM